MTTPTTKALFSAMPTADTPELARQIQAQERLAAVLWWRGQVSANDNDANVVAPPPLPPTHGEKLHLLVHDEHWTKQAFDTFADWVQHHHPGWRAVQQTLVSAPDYQAHGIPVPSGNNTKPTVVTNLVYDNIDKTKTTVASKRHDVKLPPGISLITASTALVTDKQVGGTRTKSNTTARSFPSFVALTPPLQIHVLQYLSGVELNQFVAATQGNTALHALSQTDTVWEGPLWRFIQQSLDGAFPPGRNGSRDPEAPIVPLSQRPQWQSSSTTLIQWWRQNTALEGRNNDNSDRQLNCTCAWTGLSHLLDLVDWYKEQDKTFQSIASANEYWTGTPPQNRRRYKFQPLCRKHDLDWLLHDVTLYEYYQKLVSVYNPGRFGAHF